MELTAEEQALLAAMQDEEFREKVLLILQKPQ